MASIYGNSTWTNVGTAPTGSAEVNGLLVGYKWGGGLGTGATITYSFPTNFSVTSNFLGLGTGSFAYSGWADDGGQALSAAQVTAARTALQKWGNVANINFVEIADTPDTNGLPFADNSSVGDLRFAMSNEPGTAEVADFPGGINGTGAGSPGDIWFNKTDFNNPNVGTYAFYTFMHEIGHALGLEHPHDNWDSDTMPIGTDALKYSIMSYRDFVGDNTGSVGSSFFPTGPMLYDILAIQALYGANWSYNSGNNTYSWAAGATVYEAIWDGGGIDTITASNQNQSVILHLTSGIYSTIGASMSDTNANVRNNLVVAFNAWIENATGSGFNDELYGNTQGNVLQGLGGNDTMRGSEWGDRAIDGNDTMYGGGGDDFMGGHDGNDWMYGDAGNDSVIGDGGSDVVSGGTGNDWVVGDYTDGAGNGNDVLYGNDGADTLEGGTGNDTLYGGNDNDYLYGQSGNDFLDGEAGNDTLQGGFSTDTVNGGIGNDRIQILDGEFIDVVDGGADTDTLDMTTVTTAITFNALTGTYQGSVFGDLARTHVGIEIFRSGSGNDTIRSNGSGQYWAGAGNDTVYAGLGTPEVLDGGTGVDTLDTTSFGGGLAYTINLVTGATNYVGEAFTNFENLVSGSTVDTVTGTGVANAISTGTGNDTVDAGGGNDLVNGEEGADSLRGGSGNDTVWGAGSTVDTDLGDRLFGDDGDDLIGGSYGADFIDGGTGNDQLFGDEGNDTVTGGDGNDLVRGDWGWGEDLAGADSLTGGSGNDTLIGGGGNDTLLGGFATDTVNGGDGDDLIRILDGEYIDVVDGGIGTDTLDMTAVATAITFNALTGSYQGSVFGDVARTHAGIEIFRAGSGNDTIRSNGSGQYWAGDGNDTVYAGLGTPEVLDGGAGTDTLDTTSFGGGFDYTINLVTGATNYPGEAFTNFENLSSGGTVDTVTGTGAANVILTGAGNDTVNAGGGDDLVNGEEGADSLRGGSGNDTLWGASSTVVADVGDRLFGDGGNDLIGGSYGADHVDGGGGSDQLYGDDGNDTVLGGGGNDYLRGDWGGGFDFAGADSLNGGSGNDTMIGGGGNDTLIGGTGTDSMSGGTGDDRYGVDATTDVIVEGAGEGTDSVDSTAASYTLAGNVENLANKLGSGTQTGTGNGLDNTMTGAGADDDLLGLGGNDNLSGGAGDDSLSGGDGNDTLNGGADNDSLLGGAGDDSMIGGTGNDTFNGGGGSDSMNGGDGDDDYVGVGTGDVLAEGGGGGFDRVFSNISHTLGANFEYLELTGGGNTGTGNSAANTLVGNANNNTLSGLGGADVLDGRAGNDKLYAGSDAVEDRFVFSSALNAAGNVDTLFDAEFPEDQIRLDNDIFTALLSGGGTQTGTLAAAYYFEGTSLFGNGLNDAIGIWYDLGTGGLYYNPTSNVAGDSTLFAIVNGATSALSNADITLFG
ncbi:MAG: matrixin family metalloprotease [Burkholderiales bacterium]|nr:matrixin family metalloprotease [Burkholderiales bacterium]